MSQVHAVVWLDHVHATVISFSVGPGHVVELHSERADRKVHRKSGRPGAGHAHDDLQFFGEIVEELADTQEILIVGPGTAKTAFEKHVHTKHADLARRIVGVESLDHPTQGELLAYARKYFKRIDQLGV